MAVGEQTIIIVEDNEDVREAFVDTVEDNVDNASNVLSFADGAELLTFLRDEPISEAVVVSDVVMPRLGGFELYDRLNDQVPGLKFLFVTGYPVNQEAEYFLKREDLDILVKPFPPARFVDAVKKLLN